MGCELNTIANAQLQLHPIPHAVVYSLHSIANVHKTDGAINDGPAATGTPGATVPVKVCEPWQGEDG
jgi:hypothetical protein